MPYQPRNQRSPEAERYRKLYKTARWLKIRARQLQASPLCVMCLKAGQVTAATVCDHTVPHRGDEALFWSGPFQSLCAHHHSSAKQSEERTGKPKRIVAFDADGWPLTQ